MIDTNGSSNGNGFKINIKNIAIVTTVCIIVLACYIGIEARISRKADIGDVIELRVKQEFYAKDIQEMKTHLVKIEVILERLEKGR